MNHLQNFHVQPEAAPSAIGLDGLRIIQIDTKGDVMLKIIEGGEAIAFARVASSALRYRSAGFTTITRCGPGEARGTVDRPRTILLEVDHFPGAVLLLNLLHGYSYRPLQSDFSPDENDVARYGTLAATIFHMAVLAGKLQCVNRLKMATRAELEPFLAIRLGDHATGMEKTLQLAATAKIFDLADWFHLFTKRLIMDFPCSHNFQCLDALPTVGRFFGGSEVVSKMKRKYRP